LLPQYYIINQRSDYHCQELWLMTIEKSEKEKFVYITYARQGIIDVDQFKQVLASLASDRETTKDIIIDFGACKILTSPEIGSLVRLSTQLKGSPRIVRVIPSDELYKQFASVNLTSLDHLVIYKNRQDFKDRLTNPAG
jgi:hypothetical protein